MYKMMLGFLFVVSQLTFDVHACNFKILDAEADACVSRTWSGNFLPKSDIIDKLSFLNDLTKVNQKYTRTDTFGTFYEEAKQKIRNKNFFKFADVCKNIYEESDESTTKAAVYMLLEQVSSKYNDALKRAKLLKPAQETPRYSDTERKRLLEIFKNADKSIKVE